MLIFITVTGAVPYIYFCMKKGKQSKKYHVPKMIFNREGRSGNKASIYETGDTWSEMGYMSKIHVGNAIATLQV